MTRIYVPALSSLARAMRGKIRSRVNAPGMRPDFGKVLTGRYWSGIAEPGGWRKVELDGPGGNSDSSEFAHTKYGPARDYITSDSTRIGSTTFPQANTASLAITFIPDSTHSSIGYIFSRAGNRLYCWISSGTLYFRLGNGGNHAIGGITVGELHSLAIRWTGTSADIWFNGERTSYSYSTGSGTGPLYLGGFVHGNKDWFDGKILDFQIGEVYAPEQELKAYSRDWTSLYFANQSPFLISVPGGGGGPATITVPHADLTLSTSAPTVEVPAIAIDITVPQADLTLSTAAPTVAAQDNKDLTVPQADLTLSTTAPTVTETAPGQVTVPSTNLTLSTTAPTVAATDDRSLTIGQANLSLTTTAPSILITQEIFVPTADLLLSTTAPTVAAEINHYFTIPQGDLVLSQTAPTVDQTFDDATLIVPQAALALTTTAPSIVIGDLWTAVADTSTTWTDITDDTTT